MWEGVGESAYFYSTLHARPTESVSCTFYDSKLGLILVSLSPLGSGFPFFVANTPTPINK